MYDLTGLRLITLSALPLIGLLTWALLRLAERPGAYQTDQQIALAHSRRWRGDYGLEARQGEVAYVRGNWGLMLFLGSFIATGAVVALIATR